MRYAYHECLQVWKDLLTQGLNDDGWEYDWTTLGTVRSPSQNLKARIIAKAEGVWAGNGLIEAVNSHEQAVHRGARLRVKSLLEDGALVKTGTRICEWTGPARALLAFERPFLNLASYVSGVATRTRTLVDLAEAACPRGTPRVIATRKTLPGYRDIAIAGVLAGGGYSHRVSLAGGVLIKENHIAAAGGIRKAIEGARAVAPHLLKIEIEVRNEKELREAMGSGAEVVLLDNFSPAQVRNALKIIDRVPVRPAVEVSGGISERNISDYALSGVDLISVGSLTLSVQALDLSLLVGS